MAYTRNNRNGLKRFHYIFNKRSQKRNFFKNLFGRCIKKTFFYSFVEQKAVIVLKYFPAYRAAFKHATRFRVFIVKVQANRFYIFILYTWA